MAFEIPSALIRELVISLRKEAGVASFDPEDPSIPDLPSVEETISQLDPSPPYLRCQQCRGPLLRGLQSMVCVYCGAQQRREIPPDPIRFTSTIGYRWLLESLDLDGSEAVCAHDSTRGKKASKDQLVLSDMIDYELKWSSECKKDEDKTPQKAPHQGKISLNLAGVDLDNFFSEPKNVTSANAFKEQEVSDKEMSTETNLFPDQGNINLFENPQSSKTPGRSMECAGSDPFSSWEVGFQFASSSALPVDSKISGHSPGSYPTDGTSPREVVNIPDTEMKLEFDRTDNDAKPKDDSVPPTTTSNSWIQDNQWHSPSTILPTQTESPEIIGEVNTHTESTNNPKNVSSNIDNWVHDDLWATGGTKAPQNEKDKEDEDAFDDWQGFMSSGNVPDPLSSSWKETSTTSASTNVQAAEMNLGNLDNNLQDMDFGGFMQPDLFSGASNLHNSSADVANVQDTFTSDSSADAANVQDTFTSDRAVNVESKDDAKSKANADEHADAAMGSESVDHTVEMLTSQMPDLSFMLESKLSLPRKEDHFDTISGN